MHGAQNEILSTAFGIISLAAAPDNTLRANSDKDTTQVFSLWVEKVLANYPGNPLTYADMNQQSPRAPQTSRSCLTLACAFLAPWNILRVLLGFSRILILFN